MDIDVERFSGMASTGKNYDRKFTLVKASKIYNKVKYLFQVNKIERMINGLEQNEVYQEYEVFWEIEAKVISAKNTNPLIWQLNNAECFEITQLKNPKDIGRFFINRIQVHDGKFLLAIPRKTLIENENAIILNENTLKIIQNKFKNRKYYSNFKRYKDTFTKVKKACIMKKVVKKRK